MSNPALSNNPALNGKTLTADELRRIIPWASPEYVEHLRKGGGRLGEEESWYNLDVVEAGTHFGYAATP